MTSTSARPARAARLAAALLLALLTLTACVGGDAGSAGSAASGEAVDDPVESGESVESGGSGAVTQKGSDVARAAPLQRAVVSTGQLQLGSRGIARDRAEVLRLVAAWNGSVADEQSSGDGRGGLTWSSLTLRVPSQRFGTAMVELAQIGTVLDQSRSADDVTTQVVDNDARVRAQERSVRRVEALLGEAERLADVIAIESDLARRQADLDSLRSQQAYLADQTSLSTITVGLERLEAPADDEDASGFLAGLDSGWDALVTSSTLLLGLTGTLLPFAAVLALLGLPGWWGWRHRRARVAAGSVPEAAL